MDVDEPVVLLDGLEVHETTLGKLGDRRGGDDGRCTLSGARGQPG